MQASNWPDPGPHTSAFDVRFSERPASFLSFLSFGNFKAGTGTQSYHWYIKVVHSGSIKTYSGAREKLGLGLMTSDWANSSCMWSRADPNEHVDTSSIDGLDVFSTQLISRSGSRDFTPVRTHYCPISCAAGSHAE